MVNSRFHSFLILLVPSIALAFPALSKYEGIKTRLWGRKNTGDNNMMTMMLSLQTDRSRRDFFQYVASSAAIGSLITTLVAPQTSNADSSTPIVLVLGGSGFVGSRVVKKLDDLGVHVMATSRDGRDGTIAFDVTSAGIDVADKMETLSKGCTAVISCIGAIGTPNDASINSATGLAAVGAKAAGVDKFVYISVAPEVREIAKDIDFLKPYMAGKMFSQESVVASFPSGSYTLIEPTFIHDGGQFNVNPPQVAGFYGEFIEALLSSPPLRAITHIAPGGFVEIALEPPVSVESVAGAAVAGALGKTQRYTLDTHDKIKEAGYRV